MFERFTAPAVALSAVLMTVPALADVVTLPLAPQVDNGLNPPFGDNDARLQVEVFLGTSSAASILSDSGFSGQLVVDVARDAGGNVTSIQFLPDSVLIFDNVVGIIVPLGLFGTVEAQLLDVQIALANQTLVPGGFELSADSPIPVVPAGIDPLTGDDLYTGNVAGQGATVITGTAILQGTNPTDPIYGFFDPITGRSEIDLVDPFGPFLEFAPGTLEVVDGDTKVYNIRFDFSGFIDNLISEPSLRLTSDLTITSRVVAVPEAGSMTMVALAMGGLGLAAFRRRRQG